MVLALASTFLMFWLWGFPFDKARRKSEAPRALMLLHRGLGFAYAAIYVFMMFHMVPRMWEYQVELPARTVAHLLLGFTIGVILILKISIMRFFRHLEEWMPVLGTLLLLCTVLLLGLSLPFALRERFMASRAAGGDVYSADSRRSAAERLAEADLPAGTDVLALTEVAQLRAGREVLLNKCVRCHDLKTILAKPRTATDWWETVLRMEEKPAVFAPITAAESLAVTAYLVALTPELARSRKLQREQESGHREAAAEAAGEGGGEATADAGVPDAAAPILDAGPTTPDAATVVPVPGTTAPPIATRKPAAPVDPAKTRAAFKRLCKGCHDASDTDDAPPRTEAGVNKLIRRMVENGMTAKPGDIRLVKWYLVEKYVKKRLE